MEELIKKQLELLAVKKAEYLRSRMLALRVCSRFCKRVCCFCCTKGRAVGKNQEEQQAIMKAGSLAAQIAEIKKALELLVAQQDALEQVREHLPDEEGLSDR